MSSPLQQLAMQALLGSERQPLRLPAVDGPVGALLQQIAHEAQDAESAVLRLAGDEGDAENGVTADDSPDDGPATALAADTLDWLVRAAGYGDGEAWWNHLVEERGDGFDLFAAIGEAMSSVRAEVPVRRRPADQRLEALREAHIR